jgi:cephalosporin hydroxylase
MPPLLRRTATVLGRLLPDRLKSRIATELSVRSLLRGRDKCRSVSDFCQLTFDWSGYGECHTIRSLQHITEEVSFFEYVAQRKPSTALEIGTCNGGTLFVMLACASPDCHAISVDLPDGIHGGGYDERKSEFMLRAFCRPGQKLDLVRADSRAPTTLARVKEILQGKQLDYLYIDGDHRYEGVLGDFLLYAPFVRKGGLIAFHDVAPIVQPGVDVPGLWATLKTFAPSIEFIRPKLGRELLVGGIGVLVDWDPTKLQQIRASLGEPAERPVLAPAT